MKIDKSVINSINRQTVLSIIRSHGIIGRAKIAQYTKLSLPTVMKITESLRDMGLVREIGKGESSGGKPPKLVEFVPDSYYSIGVDIGTTNLTCIIADIGANIECKIVWPTNRSQMAVQGEFVERVGDCIEAALNKTGVPKEKMLGIGIGMPGLIDPDTHRVVFSPTISLTDLDIVNPLHKRFQMPTFIENMTRAMAVGEKNFGVCRDVDNFLCVNLGYGIGAALVMKGELYGGTSGSAGELGHITIKPHGILCECGRRGCLEAMASANAISRDAKARLKAGEQSLILELAGGDIDAVDAKAVYDAAKAGDALAIELVNQVIEYLGIGLASMTTMFDPEYIVLEGGVSRAGSILTDKLSVLLENYKMPHCGKYTKIVVSRFGADAAAIGAASLILNKFLEYGGDLAGLNP